MKGLVNLKKDLGKAIREKDLIQIMLIFVFVIQFLITVYFNIQLLANHMGYDSSWTYLKAALMWDERAVVSSAWIDQTSVFFDSSMIIASLLYGITGELLVSYGIANLVVLVGIVLCIYDITDRMGINLRARMVALNLVICPYLTNGFWCVNDLGYFNNVISGPAFYSLRALVVLMIVRELIVIKSNGKLDLLGYISILLCGLCGTSSGIFIIVMILLPYVLYEMECMFLENDIKILFKREALYGYACIGVTLLGKIFSKHILHIEAIDASRTWTPIADLWANTGAVIQGFLKLLGVLPVVEDSIQIMTLEGLYRLFPLFIFFVVILSVGFAIRKLSKGLLEEQGALLFLLNGVVCNFVMFSLFNVQYGSSVYEERYLISTYMLVIIIVAYFIQNLNMTQIFSQCLCIGLVLALMGNNFVSDWKYVNTTNESWQMDEIHSVVSETNAEVVYFWGDELITTARSMRVYDMERIYKMIETGGGFKHWGDYTYYDDNEDYEGETVLIVPKNQDFVPENILAQYSFVCELNEVYVYKCETNPIDMTVGIAGDYSVDYPSSWKMYTQYGQFEGNSYVTDGTAGLVMCGPSAETTNGVYDFTLQYEILEGEGAVFEIVVDGEQVGVTEIQPEQKQVTISDVALEENHTLEYRVICEEGTKIRIDKVMINKK